MKNQIIFEKSVFSNSTGGNLLFSAGNKLNKALPSKVKFVDSVIKGNNAKFSTFMLVKENSELEIDSSTIEENFSFEKGGVLCGDYRFTKSVVKNSVIKKNASVKGGVFCALYESHIRVENCTIEDNFAITAAVIQANSDGYFGFYNCTIIKNQALSVPIAEIQDSPELSVINNCIINSNKRLNITQFRFELENNVASCLYLCSLPYKFRLHLSKNMGLLVVEDSPHSFKSILSSLDISNDTVISDEPNFISVFGSTVSIENTEFKDSILSAKPMFDVTQTKLSFELSGIKNISSSDPLSLLLRVTLVSNIEIKDSKFIDVATAFIDSRTSTLKISDSKFKTVTSKSRNVLLIDQSPELTLQNVEFEKLTSESKISPIFIRSSTVPDISNSKFSNSPQTIIQV
jgi:hypothetical protein